MKQNIAYLTLLVSDYDEAIDFYTNKLRFHVVEDTILSEDKRWVLVAPPGGNSVSILLAKASGSQQQEYIGNQTGGRVFLFLQTDNFRRDYNDMKSRGVTFIQEPRTESYGMVAVFEDLYGNKWDILELRKADNPIEYLP